MKNPQKYLATRFLFLILFSLLIQCNGKDENVTTKFYDTDPFKKTMVPSQFYEINPKKDNVIQGENGTIIVFPKNCFIKQNGEIVKTKVKIELSEAFNLADMILSNLTTTSNGKLLETAGMIYFNATTIDGEQLAIDKNNPIYIEIPTNKRKPGMLAYQGIRDENGNMNWINPKKIDNFLASVDIDLLNFYPKGFENEVIKGMPFRNHKIADKQLIDSLYYSLSKSNGSFLMNKLENAKINEAYYDPYQTVKNGEYIELDSVEKQKLYLMSSCGIDPAIIKVIRNKKFQNTLISTREFETRLQEIFNICRNDILEIYINNLDKNLWEIDSLVANRLGKTHRNYQKFIDFYKQKLTKVEKENKYTKLLADYYNKQLKKVNAELEKTYKKAVKKQEKENKIASRLIKKYKKLLNKREKFRMETYGFQWTDTGWINIDIGTQPKSWDMIKLELEIQNQNEFNHIFTYVYYTSIKSLYRLNTDDNKHFYVGNNIEKAMLMPKNSLAILVSIAYKDDKVYYAYKEINTNSKKLIKLNLVEKNPKEIKKELKKFENNGIENSIEKDLSFQIPLSNEQKRQEKLKKESEFIEKLWKVIRPCCETYYDKTYAIEKEINVYEIDNYNQNHKEKKEKNR